MRNILALFTLPLMLFSTLSAYSIESSLSYLLDEERKYSIEELVEKGDAVDFLPGQGMSLNLGFLDGAVWIRLDVRLLRQKSGLRILEFGNANLDEVELFEVINGQINRLGMLGDRLEVNQKRESRFPRFPVYLDRDYPRSFYAKIDNSGDQFFIPISLESETQVDLRDKNLQFINGLYFGIILFVLILNLFLYMSLKETSSLHYVLYLMGLFMLQYSLEGYSMMHIWGKSAYMNNHANPIFASFSILFLIQFSRNFLNLKETMPLTEKVFKIMAMAVFLTLLASFPNTIFTYKISILSINFITLLLTLIILPLAFYIWNNGFKAARFFTLAFLVLVVGVFLFILRNFGMVENNMITEKALQIGSSIEVILLSLAIVDKFKLFKDDAVNRLEEINLMKSRANKELEIKVDERTKELKEQKEIVEDKNKEITESIVYARRIQHGLLPSEELFQKIMKEAFVLYLPKDIVSGDFYWIDQVDGYDYFSAIDCTGHGVPGAMVSVMGFNNLNRCIHEHGVREPGKILDKLVALMIAGFEKSDLNIYDGMDLALCRLDRKKGILDYAGANNPLYIISKGELKEIKATKQAIGRNDDIISYVNHQIEVQKGDWIYIFSDGLADQFGGEKNKKYKYGKFKKFLLKIHELPPEEQRHLLLYEFNLWKGDEEQIDDICVMGVKI